MMKRSLLPYYIIRNDKSLLIPKQMFEYNKIIIMTYFLKRSDGM